MNYTGEFVGAGLTLHGVQYRNESPGYVWPIAAKRDDLIALHIPPGKCWAGVGRPPRNVPAEVVVLRVVGKRGKTLTLDNALPPIYLPRKKWGKLA